MKEKPYWNQEVETRSVEAQKALDIQALRQQLEYVYQHSSLYRNLFAGSGVTPQNFTCLDDLKNFPFTTKEDLRRTQEKEGGLGGHRCAPMENIIRVQGTSGTTGRPLFIGLTRNDVDLWNELFARHAWTGGLRPCDVIVNPANFTLFVGGLSECSGAESMGMTVIPAPFVSTGTEKFMEIIKNFMPTVLFSTPSATVFLEDAIREILQVEPYELGFKKGFLAGEALSDDERERIEKTWGIVARNFYGLADVAADIAAECGRSKGLHFCGQDALVAELIDPDTLTVIPMETGAEGEIVFTTIGREATPVIRYRVRDIVRIYTDPCACGRTGFRFHIIGRSDDMIKVKGVNVFPSAVKGVIQSFVPDTTGEFRIVLPHKGPSFGENLTIKVEVREGLQPEELKRLGENMIRVIREKLVFTPRIEWIPAESLERSQYKVEYFERAYQKEA
jgi:phenylacetate-CoA ligase